MVHNKLILGGLAATGSVATAGVVANQYGLFNIGSSTEGNQNTETGPVTGQTKQQEISEWLKQNQGQGIWKIQIKKSDGKTANLDSVEETELEGLKGHLEDKKDPLKSLFAIVSENTLTFEKKNETWTYSITHGNITTWVSTNWDSSTTLKIEDGSTTNLSELQEDNLRALFEHLFSVKTTFVRTGGASEARTLLFKKDGNNWKHIKVVLEEKLKEKFGSQASINLKESGSTTKDISQISDEDLKKLLDHLTSKETELIKFKKDDQTTSLTFKKEGTNLELVYYQGIIDSWVKNSSNGKRTLKLQQGDAVKTPEDDGEWKKLFEEIKKEETNLSSSTDPVKAVVFEKVNEDWKHIKNAIKEWLASSNDGGGGKFTISIKNSTETPYASEDDDNLIGLLSYLKTNKNDLIKFPKDSSTALIFKKTGNNWGVIHNKDTITNWVNNTSNNKATLKLQEGNSEKTLDSMKDNESDLNELFKGVKAEETMFSSLKSTDPEKTIVFEKVDSEWKHIKKAIKKLLSDNSWDESKIKICSGSDSKNVDSTEDKNLMGFYSHLKTYQENDSDLKKGSASADVIFKKETSTWSKKSCT